MSLLEYEKKYYSDGKKYIAGIDEVGRGPLAGPVCAAAVILPMIICFAEIHFSVNPTEERI